MTKSKMSVGKSAANPASANPELENLLSLVGDACDAASQGFAQAPSPGEHVGRITDVRVSSFTSSKDGKQYGIVALTVECLDGPDTGNVREVAAFGNNGGSTRTILEPLAAAINDGKPVEGYAQKVRLISAKAVGLMVQFTVEERVLDSGKKVVNIHITGAGAED